MSGFFGRPWSSAYPASVEIGPGRDRVDLHDATRARPKRRSGCLIRVVASTRFSPVIQACLPSRARARGTTLRNSQHVLGPARPGGGLGPGPHDPEIEVVHRPDLLDVLERLGEV